ncbi:MAG TPA: ATP-binding protein [Myxococcales bacterium]|nr:ATP-binding protein [Myxococcales bacterium]
MSRPVPLQQSMEGARYVEFVGRLNAFNGQGALFINLLMLASIWGKWPQFGIVFGIALLASVFNIWINLVYLKKRGLQAELLRCGVNAVVTLATGYVAGWTLPCWFWLPFFALVLDHLQGKIAVVSLAGFCIFTDIGALLDGVHWMYPLSFSLLAVFCSEISRRRFYVIRDMLGRSDEQRDDLVKAHALLQQVHDELTAATKTGMQMEVRLRQAQKLESVGRLAAGVAHEINTPVQFVGDSLQFLQETSSDLLTAVEKQQAGVSCGDLDLPYLVTSVPKAFDRCRDGLERVASIVRAMKDFAHPDAKEMQPVDLNRAIESTLTIARNEYKYAAELTTDFGDLPHVMAHAGDFNQAVLNIVINAAHAVSDVVKGSGELGRITVRTRRENDWVVVSVADTGAGIPEEIRDRIFDPFFTTKEVGRGTGQGLAIARAVVVEKHKGELTMTTEPGKGTTFFIRLPLHGTPRLAA